jgi:RNA polymerase sigma-70 factor, ECF subfamily
MGTFPLLDRGRGKDMLNVAHKQPATELDDATLRRAMRGDGDATRRMVELYQDRVFALVSRMLSGRGRATIEDIAQDTFLAVFRQLAQFDLRGSAKLSTWILTIAARRSIDELRKQRPVLLAEPDRDRASDSRTDERMQRREIALAIEAALRDLSPELRAAFLMREFHGLEYAEIAKALQIDLGTVKSRLSRARAGLRERLAEVV